MKQIATKIGGPLLSLFLLSACGQKTQAVNHAEMLEGDCGVTRLTELRSGEKTIEAYKQFVGFSRDCANYQLLATLVKHEIENPEMRAITVSAVLGMFAEQDPAFKKSLITGLKKYNISEQDLIDRKQIDGALQSAYKTPGTQCVDVDAGRFICE